MNNQPDNQMLSEAGRVADRKIVMKYRLPVSILVLFALVALGFGMAAPIAAAIPNNQTAPSAAAISPLVVHFPKMPQSGYNFSYTYNVSRSTSLPNQEIVALQKLIQGPTIAEINNFNLQNIVPTSLGNCGAPPLGAFNAGKFMYKRQISGTNVNYQIHFCQPFTISGVGSEARMVSAITNTLWANLNYVSGVNNISAIKISYSNNQCTGGSGGICWP